MVGAQRDRRARPRPHHRALPRDHAHRTEGAVVLRRLGVDQIGERDHDRRAHVGIGRVDEAGDLRVGVRQVDLEVAAPLGHLGADVHVLRAVAVVVEHRLAVVDAIRPARDHGAHLTLGAIQHGLDRGVRGRRAELLEQGGKAALADPGRADHRREVAAKLARVPHVQHDQVEHVLAQPARLVEPERRDPDALLPDLGGARVVGAVRGAADVALMRAVDRPERQPVAIEHRHERGQIRQVVAAVVGVVEQEHVARPDVAAKVVVHRTRRPRAARRHGSARAPPGRSGAPRRRTARSRNRGSS